MRRPVTSEGLRGEDLWPEWTPIVEAAFATLLGIVVALQSHPGTSINVRLAAAAVPAIVWVSCVLWNQPPFVVRATLILAAVAVFAAHPAPVDIAPFFLVVLVGESVAVAPLWQSIVVTTAAAGLVVGFDVAGNYDGSLPWVLAFGFTWMASAFLQSRLRLLYTVRERAVFDERQRIARELHDVIAHSLAVTMLHLTGARLALERDPADAANALLEAERLGRQSLAQIRRTIGVLAPGDGAPSSPMPSAVDIADLVREVADAGLEVHFDCVGDLATIPTTAGLTIYRIVQESLANVVKHAPGAAATVLVRVGDDDVHVEVVNTCMAAARAARVRDDGGGMGLTLMRERTDLLGGTVSAGPNGDSWRVQATLPKLPT